LAKSFSYDVISQSNNNLYLKIIMVNIANPQLLNLHVCAGEASDFSDVQAVKTPEAQDNWQPVAHDRLIEDFRSAIDNNDSLEIVQEHHTLHRYGQRYFGLFQVKGISRKHGDEVGTVFGLRNSHDKSSRAMICAGDAPFVCTNMIFNNEIVLGRRHTTHIFRDLPSLLSRAIGELCESWNSSEKRIDSYKATELDDRTAHDLIIRGFRAGACSKTQVTDIVNQWHSPEHDEFSGRDLWSLSNAFTNVYRGNLTNTAKRSASLHSVLDTYANAMQVKHGELVVNAS
jgi:hypothetical protein